MLTSPLMPGLSSLFAFCALILSLPSMGAEAAVSISLSELSGRDLMQAVYDRHRQYPYVYEEQSIVLIDRQGNRETRKAKRYSRVDKNQQQRLLLLFDSPEEVNGVAVLAERDPNGDTRQAIYFPALGESLVENSGEAGDASFLGTDFSVENLTGEQLEDYRYQRRRDVMINHKLYSVVDVFGLEKSSDLIPLRRHFISQDNLYVTRTDYYDDLGRVRKRQTQHDLTQVLGSMWRANMLLMENFHNEHQTIIKIDRRVFSKDYVPREVFTTEYLVQYSQSTPPEQDEVDVEAEAELTGGAEQ
ncbi:MAG: outer membrane lipoprotein-sorting protein [bacterium]